MWPRHMPHHRPVVRMHQLRGRRAKQPPERRETQGHARSASLPHRAIAPRSDTRACAPAVPACGVPMERSLGSLVAKHQMPGRARAPAAQQPVHLPRELCALGCAMLPRALHLRGCQPLKPSCSSIQQQLRPLHPHIPQMCGVRWASSLRRRGGTQTVFDAASPLPTPG